MLKVALVGVGGISGAHIPAWESMDDAELVAICDIRPERMENFPDKRHYTDFDEMLEKEDVDILDICLPTFLHADFAVKAMEKGINVICEKPISLKREDVQRVYSTAKNNNVCFRCSDFGRNTKLSKAYTTAANTENCFLHRCAGSAGYPNGAGTIG